MDKYQNRHIRQVEHATKQWEARVSKVPNNNDRRKPLERQTSTTIDTNAIESEENFRITRSLLFFRQRIRITSMFWKYEVHENIT